MQIPGIWPRTFHPRPPSIYGDLPSVYAQSRTFQRVCGRAGVRTFHSPLRGGHLPAAADLITFQRACGREGLPFSAAGRAPSSGSGPDIAACSRAANLEFLRADGARGWKESRRARVRAEQGCAGSMRPRGRRRDLRAELARRQPIAGGRTGAVHAYTNLI